MSLRRRLVAGTLLLLVAAIATTDVVTLSSLRSFLYGRIDEQVDVAQAQAYTYIEVSYLRAVQARAGAASTDPGAWLAQLSGQTTLPETVDQPGLDTTGGSGTAPTPVPRAGRLSAAALAARVSPDIYVEILGAGGQVVFRRPSGSSAQQDAAPLLPAKLPVRRAPPIHRFGTAHGAYLPDQPSFTAPVRRGRGPYYRGEALSVPGGTLVTAIALAPTEQTLSSLTRDEVVVSAVVVVALLLLTLWIVRIGLRPLVEMTSTARAIAAGDMRRRIRRSDERSEVGRLGGALNGMLSQIEAAFAERGRSEARLRRFVADASHELRTPLTSIRGYAELLRKGALGDDQARRRAAERIEHEAARMGVLVDDLLLLARLDQGRALERERVDLAKVAAEAVEAARAGDPNRPITARLAPGSVVDGDAARLRQVVDNLLANASVHTAAGTPVHVTVGRTNAGVELVVADEGPGFAPEEAERVFDRFYRGAAARGRPGTGLGLSIVAALAAAHGGRAEVRSAPGGGASFRVDLPAAGDGDSGGEAAVAGEASSLAGAPGNGAEADEGAVGEPARR